MRPPLNGRSWLALTDQSLDIGSIYSWCLDPKCGAVVLFSGTVRDHSVDVETRRDGVEALTYEAYETQALEKFAEIEAEARRRWADAVKIVVIHRLGEVALSESSVVVAVSAPHRPNAFSAASWLIDAVKAAAPIWKHERWAGGEGWGTSATAPVSPAEVRPS